MPTVIKITGRSSSITNAFINSIIPVIQPQEVDIKEALSILKMDIEHFQCVYCGDKSTEWDHLRPLVLNQKPTGYISEIQNLIPSCGKCNQSKGNKDWHSWIISDAPKSPKSRNIKDLEQRIENIKAYENWRKPTKVNFESVVGSERWQKHWENWQNVLQTMQDSQALASEIRHIIANEYEVNNTVQIQDLNRQTAQNITSNEIQLEINKVRNKLSLWANRPEQICSKILNKYLELSSGGSSITLGKLKSALPELKTFNANFNQMKIISERNHAKIFEINNDLIEIWQPVKNLIDQYQKDINGNGIR